MTVRSIGYDIFRKAIACLAAGTVFITSLMPASGVSYAQSVSALPQPGERIGISASFDPPLLQGIRVDVKHPLQFDFIVDYAKAKKGNEALQRALRYFLTALTVPEDDVWVNLSPYEKDRIMPQVFGETEMGRDLLAQDYILKQLTSSLMHPQGAQGKVFWEKVYAKSQEKFGTTDIPIDTFNKVWIVPDTADVWVHDAAAYVTSSRLKVMLESDYLAQPKGDNEIAKEILRETIIPVLEREVNEGRRFAPLRQIYQAMILAAWYKRKFKTSLLGSFIDQQKILGVDIADKQQKDKIWSRYFLAFKKGVFNFIREEPDHVTHELIPRKYFAGGARMDVSQKYREHSDFAEKTDSGKKRDAEVVRVSLKPWPVELFTTRNLTEKGFTDHERTDFQRVIEYVKERLNGRTNSRQYPPGWKEDFEMALSGLKRDGKVLFLSRHISSLVKSGNLSGRLEAVFELANEVYSDGRAVLQGGEIFNLIIRRGADVPAEMIWIRQAVLERKQREDKVIELMAGLKRKGQAIFTPGMYAKLEKRVGFLERLSAADKLMRMEGLSLKGTDIYMLVAGASAERIPQVVEEVEKIGNMKDIYGQHLFTSSELVFVALNKTSWEKKKRFINWLERRGFEGEQIRRIMMNASSPDKLIYNILKLFSEQRVRFSHYHVSRLISISGDGAVKIDHIDKLIDRGLTSGQITIIMQHPSLFEEKLAIIDALLKENIGVKSDSEIRRSAIAGLFKDKRVFPLKDFLEVWKHLKKKGAPARLILKMFTQPEYFAELCQAWYGSSIENWPAHARSARFWLLKNNSVSEEDLLMLAGKLLPVENFEVFKHYIELDVRRDKRLAQELNVDEKRDTQVVRRLMMSFNSLNRQVAGWLLRDYWLKENLLISRALFGEKKDGIRDYIANYRWDRPQASIQKLEQNLTYISGHYEQFIKWRQLSSDTRRILQFRNKLRREKLSDDIILRMLTVRYGGFNVAQAFNEVKGDWSYDYVYGDGMSMDGFWQEEFDDDTSDAPKMMVRFFIEKRDVEVVYGRNIREALSEYLKSRNGEADQALSLLTGDHEATLNGKKIVLTDHLQRSFDSVLNTIVISSPAPALSIDAAEMAAQEKKTAFDVQEKEFFQKIVFLAENNPIGRFSRPEKLQKFADLRRSIPQLRRQGAFLFTSQQAEKLVTKRGLDARLVLGFKLAEMRYSNGDVVFQGNDIFEVISEVGQERLSDVAERALWLKEQNDPGQARRFIDGAHIAQCLLPDYNLMRFKLFFHWLRKNGFEGSELVMILTGAEDIFNKMVLIKMLMQFNEKNTDQRLFTQGHIARILLTRGDMRLKLVLTEIFRRAGFDGTDITNIICLGGLLKGDASDVAAALIKTQEFIEWLSREIPGVSLSQIGRIIGSSGTREEKKIKITALVNEGFTGAQITQELFAGSIRRDQVFAGFLNSSRAQGNEKSAGAETQEAWRRQFVEINQEIALAEQSTRAVLQQEAVKERYEFQLEEAWAGLSRAGKPLFTFEQQQAMRVKGQLLKRLDIARKLSEMTYSDGSYCFIGNEIFYIVNKRAMKWLDEIVDEVNWLRNQLVVKTGERRFVSSHMVRIVLAKGSFVEKQKEIEVYLRDGFDGSAAAFLLGSRESFEAKESFIKFLRARGFTNSQIAHEIVYSGRSIPEKKSLIRWLLQEGFGCEHIAKLVAYGAREEQIRRLRELKANDGQTPLLSNIEIALCFIRKKAFDADRFILLWKELQSTGLTHRQVLNYSLYPELIRKRLLVWSTENMERWSERALKVRYALLKQSRVNLRHALLLASQFLQDDEYRRFEKYARDSLSEEELLWKELKRTGEPDQAVLKRLLASFSLKMRQNAFNLLKYAWLQDQYNEFEKKYPDQTAEFDRWIRQYDWSRPTASLRNLNVNIIFRAKEAKLVFQNNLKVTSGQELNNSSFADQAAIRLYQDALAEREHNEADGAIVEIQVPGFKAETVTARSLRETMDEYFKVVNGDAVKIADIIARGQVLLNGKPITLRKMPNRPLPKPNNILSVVLSKDPAMLNPGGIDLTDKRMNIKTSGSGAEAAFSLNPVVSRGVDQAPGFVPVIVSRQPMRATVSEFLGIENLANSAALYSGR